MGQKVLDMINKSLRYTLMDKAENSNAKVLKTGVGLKSGI